MKYSMTVCALSLALLTTLPFAANARDACQARAADKKLSGSAKQDFLKKCRANSKTTASPARQACAKSAAEKKLVGSAKDSYVKKCVSDGGKKSFWR
jgi:hypothetical protein